MLVHSLILDTGIYRQAGVVYLHITLPGSFTVKPISLHHFLQEFIIKSLTAAEVEKLLTSDVIDELDKTTMRKVIARSAELTRAAQEASARKSQPPPPRHRGYGGRGGFGSSLW